MNELTILESSFRFLIIQFWFFLQAIPIPLTLAQIAFNTLSNIEQNGNNVISNSNSVTFSYNIYSGSDWAKQAPLVLTFIYVGEITIRLLWAAFKYHRRFKAAIQVGIYFQVTILQFLYITTNYMGKQLHNVFSNFPRRLCSPWNGNLSIHCILSVRLILLRQWRLCG